MRKRAAVMHHITSQLHNSGLAPVVPFFIYSRLYHVVIQHSVCHDWINESLLQTG